MASRARSRRHRHRLAEGQVEGTDLVSPHGNSRRAQVELGGGRIFENLTPAAHGHSRERWTAILFVEVIAKRLILVVVVSRNALHLSQEVGLRVGARYKAGRSSLESP